MTTTHGEQFSPDHIHSTPDGRHFRHGDGVEVNGDGTPLMTAYWLDGTPYCRSCVEGDEPCLSADEIRRATRGQSSGRCGCCGEELQ